MVCKLHLSHENKMTHLIRLKIQLGGGVIEHIEYWAGSHVGQDDNWAKDIWAKDIWARMDIWARDIWAHGHLGQKDIWAIDIWARGHLGQSEACVRLKSIPVST